MIKGQSQDSLSKKFHQSLGPLEVKTKAMEVGVSFAWDVHIRDVVFECDSKIVADTLSGLCTPLVSNILARLALKLRDFQSTQLPHVMQQGNKPGHILEKYAKEVENNDNYVTWIEENPLLIELAINHDVMNLSFS